MQHHPIVLIILDGWGYTDTTDHNPIKAVPTPTFDTLYKNHPHILLSASGKDVGLPEGQMGNSEVGHLHIGAGRKVPQDLTRINNSITSGEFNNNPTLLKAIHTAKKNNKAIHILGLVSPGGVHSLNIHIEALITLIHAQGISKNYLHAILDGRDTPPKSAANSLEKIAALYTQLGTGQIASLIGRYFAMDRDKRWERTQVAYDLLTQGIADYTTDNAITALNHAYENNQADEFVRPVTLHKNNHPPITIQEGDVVIFMNFRADRARQLSYALTEEHFSHFKRKIFPKISTYVTLTRYAKNLKAEIAFPELTLNNTLGEFVAAQGLKQLRIAETEKYAHVTYFVNGGREEPFANEDRTLIPSPKVATYDLQPEMSALELTDKLIAAINTRTYDLIICNYANPDMIGHTGKLDAAKEAISVIDRCIARVLASLHAVQGEALITADHGNIECMYDEIHHQPHTAHTTNLVPLIYFGRPAHFTENTGALDDIAPTILYLLGFKAPSEMTGHNLLKII